MRTRVDIALVREGKLNLQGWAFGQDPETEVKYEVRNDRGETVPAEIGSVRRDSVVEAYFKDYVKTHGEIRRELGYDINVPYDRERTYYLIMSVDGKTRKYRFNEHDIEAFNSYAHKKREKLLALANWETVEVSLAYLREHGLRALFHKAVHKVKGIQEDYDYNEWYKKTCTTDEQLSEQRKTKFAVEPTFAIVIPAFKTPEKFLRRMLQSIEEQTYGKFEVCVADATPYDGLKWMPSDGKMPREVLEEFSRKDPRFRFTVLEQNLGISDNTNAAIRMADDAADFIVLADHDDELAPDALFECAKAINENPDIQVIYTDEDKIDFESAYRFEPHFKTDFNPDLLRSVNYICHMFVARRTLLDSIADRDEAGQLQYERKAYDGAQDYDLILRCCEAAQAMDPLNPAGEASSKTAESAPAGQASGKTAEPAPAGKASGKTAESAPAGEAAAELKAGIYTSGNIHHIRKALYHWRSHQMSTAANPEAKLYAFTAGERAIYDHCRRMGLPVREVKKGITYGFYHVKYENQNPLISVIIPNKDHTGDLDKAIRSLIRGNYRNLEFIVVENNSEKQETFDYYDRIQAEFPGMTSDGAAGSSTAAAAGPETITEPAGTETAKTAGAAIPAGTEGAASGISVRVVKWPREFNYSAINNFGVQYARGAYLLFLNNDVELINPDSLSEMIGFVQREDVGACGARLLYPDEVIQHAGVVVGFGGIAGAAFIGIRNDELTYMHRAKCIQDYSAVTAACLLSRRSVFDAVGGFTEALAVAFNDIDYCMKVRALGKLVVYNPYAKFYHYESKSRGLEDTPEKVARFNAEIRRFADRWPEILAQGDPYYNPALTLRKSNFVLRDLNKEQPGEPFPLEV